MRLSEVSGERVFDVIAGIIEPVSRIASDKQVMDLFSSVTGNGSESNEALFLMKLAKAMPSLISGHKNDIIAILATIDDISEAEYVNGLTLPKLIGDVYSIFTDEDLLVFLQRSETSGQDE